MGRDENGNRRPRAGGSGESGGEQDPELPATRTPTAGEERASDRELTYGPLATDDERFRRILRYAFRPEAGPGDPAERARLSPTPRGLFEGDDLVAVCGFFTFRAQLRGDMRRVGGVAAVATPPEHRRRGHVRRLLSELSREFGEDSTSFSVLWPFDRAFYRQFGWATCNRYRTIEAPPSQLRTAAADPAGQFRRVEADDWTDLVDVNRTHGGGYQLHIERREAWWRGRVFIRWDTDPYVYCWEREGEPAGYVVFTVETNDDGRLLQVRELAYRDQGAYRQLLRFLANHDTQVEAVRIYGPAADPPRLLDLVRTPEAVTYELHAGPMLRVEDVAGGLSTLAYPDVDVDIRFELTDPLVDENGGTYRLSVDAGDGHCHPVDATPDVTLDVGALAQLCVGYRSATELATAGDMSGSEADQEALDRAFPPAEVFLRERF